jgi:hypothetical protein
MYTPPEPYFIMVGEHTALQEVSAQRQAFNAVDDPEYKQTI